MYKIGIIGSGPEHLMEHDKVRCTIGRTIDLLGFQYGADSVVFSIDVKIGVGLWTTEECIDRNYKYHLFLPYSLEETYKHWYGHQKDMLQRQYDNTYSLTICNQSDSHKPLIDSSNLVIVFWAGNKNSKTCEAIKYALKHNKIILDGLDGLKLLTNKDVNKNIKA